MGSEAIGLVLIDLEDSVTTSQVVAHPELDPESVEAAVPALLRDNKFWDPDQQEEDFVISQLYRIVFSQSTINQQVVGPCSSYQNFVNLRMNLKSDPIRDICLNCK